MTNGFHKTADHTPNAGGCDPATHSSGGSSLAFRSHRAFASSSKFNIDSNKATKFQYGMTNVDGTGHDLLNSPYTAFVIGDYTGQTPPPQVF